MKFKIIGILVAAVVCAALYFVSQGSSSPAAGGGRLDESGIRSLNIQ